MFDATQEARQIVGEREFYVFDFGTSGREYYTTHHRKVTESVLTGASVTWLPLPISRQGARSSQGSATKFRIKIPITRAFISALSAGVVDSVTVTIIRGFGDDYVNDYRNPWFIGTVKDIACSTTEVTANLESIETIFDDLFPRVLHQAGCNNVLGDSVCGVILSAFTITRNVVSLANGGRLVIVDGALLTTDYYTLGRVRKGSGPWREVLQQAANQFVLNLPVPTLAVGDAVSLRAGCFKRIAEDCVGKFNNKPKNVSMPLVPQVNPVTEGF